MIADETSVLSDADAREAEAAVAGWWAGKTWPQLRKKLAAAVINVDPDGAEKRREENMRQGQVRMWQDRTGTSGLSATGLPTDRALMADRAVQARARAYKRWGIPEAMHLLRVRAFLDLLTQTDGRADYPKTVPAGTSTQDSGAQDSDRRTARTASGQDGPDRDGRDAEAADDSTGDDRFRGRLGRRQRTTSDDDGDRPGGGGNEPDGRRRAGRAGPSSLGLPANLDLTIPLADLLGLARRAGEARNLGTIDPGTARDLALAAARDPRTSIGIILNRPPGARHRVRPRPETKNRGGTAAGTGTGRHALARAE